MNDFDQSLVILFNGFEEHISVDRRKAEIELEVDNFKQCPI